MMLWETHGDPEGPFVLGAFGGLCHAAILEDPESPAYVVQHGIPHPCGTAAHGCSVQCALTKSA